MIADVIEGRARWHVEQGDCLDLVRAMPDASVDAIVTDPPYANTNAGSAYVAKAGGVPREVQFYEAWLREHLREWVRALKPTGGIWLTIDWRGAMALDAACSRLGLRDPKIGVWSRGGLGMGFVLRNCYECFAVVPMERFARQKTNEPDVWEHKWTPGNRRHGHSAEKPVELMARACDLLSPPGGVILDPFAGSGSTGAAALSRGYRFIGIEREIEFAETARSRCEQAAQQPDALAGAA